jgi:hypothetical protein
VALVHEAGIKPRRQKKQPKKTKDATLDSIQKPKPPVPRREKTPTPRYVPRTHQDDSDNSDTELQSTSTSFRSHTELRVTLSQQGDQWQEPWAPLSASLTPATQRRVKVGLERTFSHQGVQDALDMAERVEQNYEVLRIDAASYSIAKLATLDSPAKAVAVHFKTVWDKNRSREIKGARLLNSYRLLAQEIQMLEHQAMHPETFERRHEPTD